MALGQKINSLEFTNTNFNDEISGQYNIKKSKFQSTEDKICDQQKNNQ